MSLDRKSYELIQESGRVIGVKRFDTKHKMWIVNRFVEDESNAEQQLMNLLTSEYLNQHSGLVKGS